MEACPTSEEVTTIVLTDQHVEDLMKPVKTEEVEESICKMC